MCTLVSPVLYNMASFQQKYSEAYKKSRKISLKSKTMIRISSSYDTYIGTSSEFAMINILKFLIKKVDNMQE